MLYDASCGFCIRCRHWLEAQPQLVKLNFVPAHSSQVGRLFPKLATGSDELIAVSDEGGVYRGTKAWLICLYALEDYREWSIRLSTPALLPAARRAFGFLSQNRRWLSNSLRLAPDDDILSAFGEPIPLPAGNRERHCGPSGC